MKIIFFVAIGVFLVGSVGKDRAAFRVLQMMLPQEIMIKEHIYLKSALIPGYSIWKLGKIRKEIYEQSKSENNPKQG